jgi:hypothetical protein
MPIGPHRKLSLNQGPAILSLVALVACSMGSGEGGAPSSQFGAIQDQDVGARIALVKQRIGAEAPALPPRVQTAQWRNV